MALHIFVVVFSLSPFVRCGCPNTISSQNIEACDKDFISKLETDFSAFGTADFGHGDEIKKYFGIDLTSKRERDDFRTLWKDNPGSYNKPGFELASILNQAEWDFVISLIKNLQPDMDPSAMYLWTAGRTDDSVSDKTKWYWKSYDNVESGYDSMCFQSWKTDSYTGGPVYYDYQADGYPVDDSDRWSMMIIGEYRGTVSTVMFGQEYLTLV